MSEPTPRRLYKHEQVKKDLIEIYAYLAARSERAAERFVEECGEAFNLILQVPGIGRRWESSVGSAPDLRVTTVSRRFRKYLIFYRPVQNGVQIVTILNGTRDLPPLIESLPLGDDPDDPE